MVNKKTRSIIIIAVTLIIAVCGYIIINGTYLQDFLKENGLSRPGASTEEVLSAAPGVDTGNPGVTAGSGKVPFGDAISELYLFDSEGLINLENTTFHEIRGFGVDLDGFADNWIIGAKKNGDNIIFSFASGEWDEMIWPGSFSEEVIDLEKDISPEMIFTKNSDTIIKHYQDANVSGSDLIMDSEVCTIIIDNGDKVAVLKFKTNTGELI